MPLYDDEIKYSVKEVSKILGINEQSLRYYDRIGLLEPYRRDPETLYRYYTINQFYLLEMFKYAKGLGLPVSEYKSLLITEEQMASKDFGCTEEAVDGLIERKRRECEALAAQLADLESMKRDISILKENDLNGRVFHQDMPPRCAYAVDHGPDMPFEATSVIMRKTRGKHKDHLTEHYGFLLDAEAARAGCLRIVRQYVVLDAMFDETDEIIHLPQGRHACFLYHGFRPEEPMESLAAFLRENGAKPAYLVADEVGFFGKVADIVHAVRVPVEIS